jgi:hypothetical protein
MFAPSLLSRMRVAGRSILVQLRSSTSTNGTPLPGASRVGTPDVFHWCPPLLLLQGVQLRTHTITSATVENSSSRIPEDEPVPDSGEWMGCRRSFMAPLRIKNERGPEILHNPLYNKGTAFKSGERDRLGFRGLLPYKVMNIHLQKERFLLALRNEESNIKKNLMLEDLHDRNETLYHRVLVDHMHEMAPLIYTPTVGQACTEFATRYRRPRGMYFTEEDRGNMAAMVRTLSFWHYLSLDLFI